MSKNQLALLYFEWVEFLAYKNTKDPRSLEDIKAAAILGLVTAASVFNQCHEHSFQNHAKPYVMKEIRREKKFQRSLGFDV